MSEVVVKSELAYNGESKRKAKIVKALIERDGDRCYYCLGKRQEGQYTVDHYIPQAMQHKDINGTITTRNQLRASLKAVLANERKDNV